MAGLKNGVTILNNLQKHTKNNEVPSRTLISNALKIIIAITTILIVIKAASIICQGGLKKPALTD
jgi:hypothetical protein